MILENGAKTVDYRRVTALLKYAAPTAFDVSGVNAIPEELDDGRVTQLVLALTAICHDRAKYLRTEAGCGCWATSPNSSG